MSHINNSSGSPSNNNYKEDTSYFSNFNSNDSEVYISDIIVSSLGYMEMVPERQRSIEIMMCFFHKHILPILVENDDYRKVSFNDEKVAKYYSTINPTTGRIPVRPGNRTPYYNITGKGYKRLCMMVPDKDRQRRYQDYFISLDDSQRRYQDHINQLEDKYQKLAEKLIAMRRECDNISRHRNAREVVYDKQQKDIEQLRIENEQLRTSLAEKESIILAIKNLC